MRNEVWRGGWRGWEEKLGCRRSEGGIDIVRGETFELESVDGGHVGGEGCVDEPVTSEKWFGHKSRGG